RRLGRAAEPPCRRAPRAARPHRTDRHHRPRARGRAGPGRARDRRRRRARPHSPRAAHDPRRPAGHRGRAAGPWRPRDPPRPPRQRLLPGGRGHSEPHAAQPRPRRRGATPRRGHHSLIPVSPSRPMLKESPDHLDADLVLKIYDLRREAVMRESRDAINRDYWPRTSEEATGVLRSDHPLNRAWRQTTGYWEMVYSMARHGIIQGDFLVENNTEGLFLFA